MRGRDYVSPYSIKPSCRQILHDDGDTNEHLAHCPYNQYRGRNINPTPNSFLKAKCSCEESGPCPIMRKNRKFISDLADTADSRINAIVRLVCPNRHHHLEPLWVILESPTAGLGGSSGRSECSRLSWSRSPGVNNRCFATSGHLLARLRSHAIGSGLRAQTHGPSR